MFSYSCLTFIRFIFRFISSFSLSLLFFISSSFRLFIFLSFCRFFVLSFCCSFVLSVCLTLFLSISCYTMWVCVSIYFSIKVWVTRYIYVIYISVFLLNMRKMNETNFAMKLQTWTNEENLPFIGSFYIYKLRSNWRNKYIELQ